jgi:protein dithiol oxidoreductase (disulfide-forming)
MHSTLRLGFALLALVSLDALAQDPGFKVGQHYFLVQPAQPTNAPPGKVEVTEVFSYACPACNQFEPVMDRLKANLPSNAVLNYVAAAFNPAEDWPVFQRCYYAAQALGIAERTQDAMFDAVWKTGELAVVDQRTNRLRTPLPTIEDCANFYQRTAGVSKEQFLATAKSFTVDTRIRHADALVLAYRADSTPTIIVNGKYRLTPNSAGGYDKTLSLIRYLVAMESR